MKLETLPAVQSVRVGEDRTEILSRCGIETVRALLAADDSIEDLEVSGADLETAFLALTDSAQPEQEAA
ncbi:MAG: hypothetical protein U5L08_14845 [Xanthomonadales bacterium]|nr:hypothetical protein [Xanthomonadales bacterium]